MWLEFFFVPGIIFELGKKNPNKLSRAECQVTNEMCFSNEKRQRKEKPLKS